MAAFMINYITRLIEEKKLSDNDIFLYLILFVSTAFAGLMHVVLLCVMLVINLPTLIIVNVGSLLVYAASLIGLVKKRHYTLAGVIIVAEVICYVLVVSLYVGTSHYIILFCFVVLFIQLIIPYSSVKVRVVVSAAIWVAMIVSLLIDESHILMKVMLSAESNMILLMTNVNLAFFGVVILLVASNAIRTAITKINATRLELYKNQARTDSLTGLYNRRYADDFFTQVFHEKMENTWCVAMLDIDDFKQINDTLGHAAGDAVICGLSNILKTNLRKTDALFRWGGEEFLLFLADVEIEAAAKILDKIAKQIRGKRFSVGQKMIDVTVTIGVSVLDVNDIEGSIERCDRRLYYGKNNGKNVVVACDHGADRAGEAAKNPSVKNNGRGKRK